MSEVVKKLERGRIPEEIFNLSRESRIIWMGKERGNPWKEITGKLRIGKKVNVERLLKEKGFEESVA